MNTFYQMWGVTTPAEAQCRLEEQRREAVEAMRRAGVSEPRNLEEQALMLIGRDVYERLIKGYTEKQWGRRCTELPAFIIKRLPVRLTFDNNYFDDRYQGIPIGGYNRLVACLLDGIETRTGCDYFENRPYWETVARRTVFTGQIDQFFDYCYGPLAYRSLRFEEQLLDTPNHQGNAVINYTESSVPYTRSIEHKHFEYFGSSVYEIPRTVVTREYPAEWKPGMEPYYPVNDERNNRLAERYRQLGALRTDVVFGGRLADYRYYDMAPVVEQALHLDL
jgi:UDP-galactopyranose mutase